MEGSSAIYLAIDEPIDCLLVPVLGCKSAELREKEPAFTEAVATLGTQGSLRKLRSQTSRAYSREFESSPIPSHSIV